MGGGGEQQGQGQQGESNSGQCAGAAFRQVLLSLLHQLFLALFQFLACRVYTQVGEIAATRQIPALYEQHLLFFFFLGGGGHSGDRASIIQVSFY